LRKPSLSVAKAAAVLLRHWFIVRRGRGQGTCDRVDHHFEQMTYGIELARIELIEQMMGMLSVHSDLAYLLSLQRACCPRQPKRLKTSGKPLIS
jgi:hypothetical protein